MRYFLNFIEEMVLNSDYFGYVGGRVEIYRQDKEDASEELRFLTKDTDAFYKFRDKFDFQEVSKRQYKKFKKQLKQFLEDINE